MTNWSSANKKHTLIDTCCGVARVDLQQPNGLLLLMPRFAAMGSAEAQTPDNQRFTVAVAA